MRISKWRNQKIKSQSQSQKNNKSLIKDKSYHLWLKFTTPNKKLVSPKFHLKVRKQNINLRVIKLLKRRVNPKPALSKLSFPCKEISGNREHSK
jgi:hypothetical protein